MAESSTQIKIVLVDDHELNTLAMRVVLNNMPDLIVVGEATNGESAIDVVRSKRPDVVVMDIGLPVVDGIQATRNVKIDHPDVRVVMLTSREGDEDLFASLAAGADGYCLKSIAFEKLASAIRAVAGGAAWLDPGVASRVLKTSIIQNQVNSLRMNRREERTSQELTEREIEVLRLIGDGLSNIEIGLSLSISTQAVKVHVRHILSKLMVSDRTQAAVKGMTEGIIN